MKKYLILVLLFAFALVARTQTTIVDSIVHDGGYRNYRVYVPAMYSGSVSVPLVINLHGYGSNAMEQEFYGDFRPIADTANFIVVHPNGTTAFGSTYWNAGFSTSGADDVGFLSSLIDSLALQYNIDLDRVYSCGMSNGGIMSYYLACNLNYRITAIGSVTGSMLTATYTACVPATPVPIIEIHGTADGTVPYAGGGGTVNIDSVVKFWANINGCDMVPVTNNYPDIVTSDMCTATEVAYLNGTANAESVLVRINSGGHTWPGAPVTIGVTNQDFDASVRLWNFFNRYRKSQFVGIAETKNQNASTLLVYPNPANTHVTVSGNFGKTIDVFEITGKLVSSVAVQGLSNQQVLDIHDFKSGVYLLKSGYATVKCVVE